jgi:hypothetical protein
MRKGLKYLQELSLHERKLVQVPTLRIFGRAEVLNELLANGTFDNYESVN